MPWCEECSRYLVPTSLNENGTCPSCGRDLENGGEQAGEDERAPWHFKLLVVATVVYLGWRFVQIFT